MKIRLKKPEEIALIKEGGQKLAKVRDDLAKLVRAGMTLKSIEAEAFKRIEVTGGKPAFTRVPGYHWATCLNINEGIVHGIPNDYPVRSGDVLSIDIGMVYRGWNTDTSTTFQVENSKAQDILLSDGETVTGQEIKKFLDTGKKALVLAIGQARPGQRIGHISATIQETIEGASYSCLRNLTGHGIGRELHEPPPIPCYVREELMATPLIKVGMVLAIEIIYAMGGYETVTAGDGWTISTRDGKIAAVFEKTIAVCDDGPLICT
ncbi:type I methionyl aminopeptidase [Candidatus Beckwithbacteria bacterium RBG_13_42_9]|uniref:Methionine aminopeptidase n=1 Tax=Candidatus Beckwithbacteria bacterium RBG_13_42_9 TaxID=1797457 RepID=A0A1F5E8Z8_9BACT|nr:MAG: type I methionyl aminopeptidase [Candidatus Beckwithbacteria bacterium RBG_13_42_9]